MRIVFALFLLGGWATAQVTYSELTEQLKQNQDAGVIREQIDNEGLAFPVDLDHLKRMKRDGFPDWLIDTLVMAHNRNLILSAPRRYADVDEYDDYRTYRHYRPSAHLFWDWVMGYPYWTYGGWSPYYSLMNPYYIPSWYWPYWGGGYYGWNNYYYWNDGTYLPGNRLYRRGYRNEVDDRVVGRARVKSGKSDRVRGSKASARSSRSSRSSVSSRSSGGGRSSSSGGGSVSSRGYSKRK